MILLMCLSVFLLLGFFVSIVIEILQLVKNVFRIALMLRVTDIGDIVSNIFRTILYYIISKKIILQLRRQI